MGRAQFSLVVLATIMLNACGDGAPERSAGAILADRICVQRSPKHREIVSERDKAEKTLATCQSDATKSAKQLTDELTQLREEKAALSIKLEELKARKIQMWMSSNYVSADRASCTSRLLAAMQSTLDEASVLNAGYNTGLKGSCKVYSYCNRDLDTESRRSWSIVAACDDGTSPSDIVSAVNEAIQP